MRIELDKDANAVATLRPVRASNPYAPSVRLHHHFHSDPGDWDRSNP